MAKVTMIAAVSGTRDGVDWPASGDVLECSDGEAADLIGAGLARPFERVKNVEPVETAILEPVVETATRKAKGN
jgi:hypothetical protein